MNKGFISLVAVAFIALGTVVVGGGGYMFYTIQHLSDENKKILEENNAIKSVTDSSQNDQPDAEKDEELATSSELFSTEDLLHEDENSVETKGVIVESKVSIASVGNDNLSNPAPVQNTNTAITGKNNSFSLRCKLSSQNVGLNDYLSVSLTVYEGQREGLNKDYEVSWNQIDLSESGDKEGKFKFDEEGSHDVSVTVKNKINNQIGTENCGTVYVECDEFDCLSKEEQQLVLQRNALDDIIDLIDDWYSDDYPLLTATYQCSIAESVVRAHLYEYTSAGGINAPEFSKDIDCANDLAPKAYKYKIELLESSL